MITRWKVSSVLKMALHNRTIAKGLVKRAEEELKDANKRVGEAFRMERKAANIGLREMARKLEISAAYLSDIELGRRNLPEFWNTKIN